MNPTPPADAPEQKKRIPLLWIAATLSVGLILAAIYLGARIVTAQRASKPMERTSITAPPSVVVTPPPVPKAIPEPVVPVAEPEPLTPAAVLPLANTGTAKDPVPIITPHAGERYIQVGALNENATRVFIQHLRSENLEPQVAPGPKPELLRVLIGPFENLDALNERKAQLEGEGIQTFVRRY